MMWLTYQVLESNLIEIFQIRQVLEYLIGYHVEIGVH
jgi:hypothetical protein